MPAKSSLRAQFERREPVRGIRRARSGTEENFVLRHSGSADAAVSAAILLVKHGLTLRQAKRIVDRLCRGETLAVTIPLIGDVEAFVAEMTATGIQAEHRRAPDSADVKSIRKALKLTQEEFAARYCFDVATVRNWEQGRNKPDGATLTVLKMIETNPKAVEKVLVRKNVGSARLDRRGRKAPGRRPVGAVRGKREVS